MKPALALLFAIILAFAFVFSAGAQAPESIWLSANLLSFKTGETVAVMVNTSSATPIQGFTFQIRYDEACLQPIGATSPLPGMNGLSLPQTPGLVDATFASTSPQAVNGALAEVRFVTLGECQTALVLQSAALAVKNEAGIAAPLPGTSLSAVELPLQISAEKGGASLPTPISGGTPLPLGEAPADSSFPAWLIVIFSGLAAIMGILVTVNLLRKP